MSKNTFRLIANIERVGIHLNNRAILIRCDALIIQNGPDLFQNSIPYGQIRGFCTTITNEIFKFTLGCSPENYSILDSSSGDYINGKVVFQESTMRFDDKTLLTLRHVDPRRRLYVAKYSDLGSVAEDMVKKIREYVYSQSLDKAHLGAA